MSDLHARLIARCNERISYIEQLGEPDDGMAYVARAVLELHAPVRQGGVFGYDTCSGCDNGSYAIDSPDSPCSTIRVIADALGVKDEELIEKESPTDA